MTDYEETYKERAERILKELDLKFNYRFNGIEHWHKEQKAPNFKYKCRLYNTKTRKSFAFDFHDSIKNYLDGVQELDAYSVINCIASDYSCGDYGNFEDFCASLGYNSDSIAALKLYRACQKTVKAVKRLCNGDKDKIELFLSIE